MKTGGYEIVSEKCGGCNLINYYGCALRHNKLGFEICPCTSCIVKSMCQKICPPRRAAFSKFNKYNKGSIVQI